MGSGYLAVERSRWEWPRPRPFSDSTVVTRRSRPETGYMKKSTNKRSRHPKLALHSETIASLTLPRLGQVVGGVVGGMVPDGSLLKECPSTEP